MIKTVSQIAKEVKRTPERVYQIVETLIKDVHYYRSNGTILVTEAGQDEIKRLIKESKRKKGRRRKVIV